MRPMRAETGRPEQESTMAGAAQAPRSMAATPLALMIRERRAVQDSPAAPDWGLRVRAAARVVRGRARRPTERLRKQTKRGRTTPHTRPTTVTEAFESG